MDEDQVISKFANVLESFDLEQVDKYLDSLPSQERLLLETLLPEVDILSRISRKKNTLGNLILRESGVEYLDEDRTRVVFLLAKYLGASFKAVQSAYKQELGDHFIFHENYLFRSRSISWKELAEKAKKIKNAYRNYDLLNARLVTDEIFHFYKIFKIEDPATLLKLVDLADKIMLLDKKRNDGKAADNSLEELRQNSMDFYKLSGFLKMSVEEIKKQEDFQEIIRFVFLAKYCSLVRLNLIDKHVPLDNYKEAEMALMRIFANTVAESYRIDSMARAHVKLKPLNSNATRS